MTAQQQLAESIERVKASDALMYSDVEPSDEGNDRFCAWTYYRRSTHLRSHWTKPKRAHAWGDYAFIMENAIERNYEEVRLHTLTVNGKTLLDAMVEKYTPRQAPPLPITTPLPRTNHHRGGDDALTHDDRLSIIAEVCTVLWQDRRYIETAEIAGKVMTHPEWVDSRESGEPWDRARRYARDYMNELVGAGKVRVVTQGTDHYNSDGTIVSYELKR